LTIALVALVHNEFECPKYLIYKLSFEYEGLIEQSSLSQRSKKLLPFTLDAWNVIFQVLRILAYSLFLSKFHDDLQEKRGEMLKFFVSLSIVAWKDQ